MGKNKTTASPETPGKMYVKYGVAYEDFAILTRKGREDVRQLIQILSHKSYSGAQKRHEDEYIFAQHKFSNLALSRADIASLHKVSFKISVVVGKEE